MNNLGNFDILAVNFVITASLSAFGLIFSSRRVQRNRVLHLVVAITMIYGGHCVTLSCRLHSVCYLPGVITRTHNTSSILSPRQIMPAESVRSPAYTILWVRSDASWSLAWIFYVSESSTCSYRERRNEVSRAERDCTLYYTKHLFAGF